MYDCQHGEDRDAHAKRKMMAKKDREGVREQCYIYSRGDGVWV